MPDSSLSFAQLIQSIGSRDFFGRYWQQQPLSVVLDEITFERVRAEVGPLDIVSKAKAARQGVQAWVSSPHMVHSVFEADATNVADFHRVGATLYFVDVPLPSITDRIADALGAPRKRMRASLFLTPRSSGASAHFDSNENFTIQLTGAKRWFVGSAPMAVAPPAGHFIGHRPVPSVEKLIIKERAGDENCYALQPGTLLYVPRGTVHRTSADAESWSLNICYSGTMWLEVLQDGLQRRLAASPKWRSTVTGASDDCEPEARNANVFPELIDELRQLLADPQEIEDLCRTFVGAPTGKR
jgi:ribosomal protein L16 Arg81 hydroxylase